MGKKKLYRAKELADDKNRDELLEILKKPKYFCKKCLRAASEGSYLCKPEKLKKREE